MTWDLRAVNVDAVMLWARGRVVRGSYWNGQRFVQRGERDDWHGFRARVFLVSADGQRAYGDVYWWHDEDAVWRAVDQAITRGPR